MNDGHDQQSNDTCESCQRQDEKIPLAADMNSVRCVIAHMLIEKYLPFYSGANLIFYCDGNALAP